MAILPEILSDKGYFTAMSGKVGNTLVINPSEIFALKNRFVILSGSGILDSEPARDPTSGGFKRLSLYFPAAVITMAGSQCRSDSHGRITASYRKWHQG